MTDDEIRELQSALVRGVPVRDPQLAIVKLDANCRAANEAIAQLIARIKQLESLLGRIHKATDQFYTKQKEDHCKKPDTVPYQTIVDLYHAILDDLPRVEKLTEKRKKSLRQRWKNDLPDLDDWEAYFKDASKKPFLFGRNERGWVANFDFFIREQTITYMQEGKYG